MKSMRQSIWQALRYWLPLAVVISLLSALILAAVQQDIRHVADDPQIQLSEDAATGLRSGQTPQSLLPTQKVDIATSLAPFIIVFDNTGRPIASSALLNGAIPDLPAGVFSYVQQHGEDRFTWQPQPGVRSAVVVNRYPTGFVLAGRSLREVEKREDDLGQIVVAGWLVSLFLSLVTIFIIAGLERRNGS